MPTRMAALLLAILPLVCAGCAADPHSVVVTDQNKDSFLDQIKDSKGLTVDEMRLLLGFQVRSEAARALGGQPLPVVGKTLGQLIEEERRFQADAKAKADEQRRLAAEAKAKEDAVAAELRKAVSLTVYDKTFRESDPMNGSFDAFIVFKCAYENTSGKDVRAFRGTVRFTDLFGAQIFVSAITISDPIAAGQKASWTGAVKYNQFTDEHVAIRNATLNDMRIEWRPASILFADGTSLGEAPPRS